MAEITLNGTELRPSNHKITAWIRSGFYGPAEYRGANDIIPEAAGQEFGQWLADRRNVELALLLQGFGVTEVLAQQDFLTTVTALRTIFIASQAAPVDLRVYSPLYGIASGYRHLSVRWVNSIEDQVIAGQRQTMTVRFECVDSPPDWVAVP